MNGIGWAALILVLGLATGFGLWRRRVDGKFARVKAPATIESVQKLTANQLGQPLGEQATLVEFSSAFCAPCRATRRVLERIEKSVDGVSLIEIDAESKLDLTREFNILRTPTVLILDSTGAVRRRAVGQPRHADVVAALAEIHGGLQPATNPST